MMIFWRELDGIQDLEKEGWNWEPLWLATVMDLSPQVVLQA